MMSTMEELEGPSKIVFCITVRGYHLHKRVSVLVSVWGGGGVLLYPERRHRSTRVTDHAFLA